MTSSPLPSEPNAEPVDQAHDGAQPAVSPAPPAEAGAAALAQAHDHGTHDHSAHDHDRGAHDDDHRTHDDDRGAHDNSAHTADAPLAATAPASSSSEGNAVVEADAPRGDGRRGRHDRQERHERHDRPDRSHDRAHKAHGHRGEAQEKKAAGSRQMIINAAASEEVRVAIIEGDRLLDLDIDVTDKSKQKGNIYKGIVANVEDSLEAAFIEFGDDKQAFVALSEVRPSLYPPEVRGQRRPKISDILKRGQEIVIQITKDEIGSKGAAATTYLSLPGRYTVLMHSDDSGGGVSRKIEDEHARRRARDILRSIDVPEGMAVIIRTAGMNRPMIDLYRDLKSLGKVWEQIDRGAALGRAPTLLYREPDLVVRTIRDYLSPDVGRIVIDSEDEYEDLKSYFEERSPDALALLERYEGRQPIFERFGIERAIEQLFERQVKLPSGGYIVIDQTEALVAIDVNSGKSTKEHDHEATVYKTNLEAAREVARQLRLRDMGGIIVIDFIDMVNRKHDRDVERAIKEAMRDDKARTKIARISENGTLEITRQRLRQAHRLVSQAPCPHCVGTGMVREPKGLATAAMRELTNRLSKTAQHLARLTIRLPVDVANIINTTKRRELLELSEQHQCLVDVQADSRMMGDELRYDEERRGRAGLDAAHAVRDPRLGRDDRRKRRGRHGEASAYAGQTLGPPPSIGPVPNFLESEDAIMDADKRALDEEERRLQDLAQGVDAPAPEVDVEEEREAAPAAHKPEPVPAAPEHYDDALLEALFGSAPEVPLEIAAPKQEEQPSKDGEGRRRKRRRRRRGGRPDGEQAAAAGSPEQGNEEAGAESAEGDAEDVDDSAILSAETLPPVPADRVDAFERVTPAQVAEEARRAHAASHVDAVADGVVKGEAAVAAHVEPTEDAIPAEAVDADGEAEAADADKKPKKRRPRRGTRGRSKASEDKAEPEGEAKVADGPAG